MQIELNSHVAFRNLIDSMDSLRKNAKGNPHVLATLNHLMKCISEIIKTQAEVSQKALENTQKELKRHEKASRRNHRVRVQHHLRQQADRVQQEEISKQMRQFLNDPNLRQHLNVSNSGPLLPSNKA